MISCKRLTEKDILKVVDFLLDKEHTCVALMSHLIENGVPVMPSPKFQYWILEDTHLHGVVMISSTGLVLHSFSSTCISLFQTNKDNLQPLKELISSHSLYCIMGEKEGTQLLQTLYEKKNRCIREYELHTYNDAGYANIEKELLKLTIRKCSENDVEVLFPLQKEYDKVEVIPDGDTLNETASKKNLLRLLKTQEIYAVVVDEHVCAKAGTNAQGLNWVQIGGVYTDTNWRNRGFARFLVSYIAHNFSLRGKKVTLFVRVGNKGLP